MPNVFLVIPLLIKRVVFLHYVIQIVLMVLSRILFGGYSCFIYALLFNFRVEK